MNGLRGTVAGLLTLLLAAVTACTNPFALREPESPIDAQSTWVPPLGPEQLMVNFRNAVMEKNVDHYVRCLADAAQDSRRFRFEPDPEVAANYPNVFAAWSRETEETVMQQTFSIVPGDSSSLLSFPEDVRQVMASDSAIFVRRYRLELQHTRDGLASVYEGLGEFRMAPDQGGEWSIYHWIDNRVGDSPSWSHLKASLGG